MDSLVRLLYMEEYIRHSFYLEIICLPYIKRFLFVLATDIMSMLVFNHEHFVKRTAVPQIFSFLVSMLINMIKQKKQV